MRVVFLVALLGTSFGLGAFGRLAQPWSRHPADAQMASASSPPTASPESPSSLLAPRESPSPSATTLYRFRYVPTPPPQPTPFPGPRAPQIYEIDLNDQTLVTPGELRVRVLTSIDVSSVVAKTMGYELAIPRAQNGVFSAEYAVPQAPPSLSGRTFDVDFVAAVPDGRTSTITLQLGLK